jgi:L-lactate dehydrogenase complex protein LldE
MNGSNSFRPRVGLFVTCLVDIFRPSVGFAAAALIDAAGCDVFVPEAQTCCGQPAYNSGTKTDAKDLALATIRAFEGLDYVVAPSGSCAGMLKVHYPRLFEDDPEHLALANAFASRVHELLDFLVNVRGMKTVPGVFQGRVTYHDACSGLRELGVSAEPRKLLSSMAGVEIVEMADVTTCCGFGGLFSVKYPDISNAMVEKKARNSERAANVLLSGDLGCLMNIAGKLRRQGSSVECRHVAEVLAGELADPPIAQGKGRS